MVKARDFNISLVEFSIYTRGQIFFQDKIFEILTNGFGDVFDGEPLSLSIPEDKLGEAPRLVLSSLDNKSKLEIAFGRINLLKLFPLEKNADEFCDFLKLWENICASYLQITDAGIVKAGIGVSRFFENSKPAQILVDCLCKESCFEGPGLFNNFELTFSRGYALGEFNVIQSLKCKNNLAAVSNAPVVIAEQQINTELLPESKRYNIKQVVDFAKAALNEEEDTFRKYFS